MTDDDQARVAGLAEDLSLVYPDSLEVCGELIESMVQDGMDSPEWCWLPMIAFAVYANAAISPHGLGMLYVSPVAALTEWQLGRGLYRPDTEVVEAARVDMYESAGIDLNDAEQWHRGKLPPLDTWTCLPEWCCYVAMPAGGHGIAGVPVVSGVFVHLEYDPTVNRPELRLLVDCDGTWEGLVPLAVALDEPNLGVALGETELSMRQHEEAGPELRALFGPYAERSLLGLLAWTVLPLALTLIDPRARFLATDAITAQPERAQPHNGVWRPAAATQLWHVTYE